MEIAGHKQNIILLSFHVLLMLLLLPLSYALFRTFGAPIYFVALINLPCDFPLSLSLCGPPLAACGTVACGRTLSRVACGTSTHSHTQTHTHTHLCMHSWMARGFCCSRTTVGILFIFIIFCRLNDHKLH